MIINQTGEWELTAFTLKTHRFIHMAQRLPQSAVHGLLAVIEAAALTRTHFDRRGVPLLHGALIVIAVVTGWWVLDRLPHRALSAEQHAFETQVFELATRALMPGSALACLDTIAGDVLKDACEKAIFASPETTAAAVSYIAAELSLLASASDRVRSTAPSLRTVQLRRAIEADRFGIAAHVLAVSKGCTPDRCSALSLLHDEARVRANLAERPFDTLIKRYAASWSAAERSPEAIDPPRAATATAPGAPPKSANTLYFPSSASIPPVNIMTAEPAVSPPRETAAAREAAALLRKPTSGGSQVRQQATPKGSGSAQ
jgi:hypothetical protein